MKKTKPLKILGSAKNFKGASWSKAESRTASAGQYLRESGPRPRSLALSIHGWALKNFWIIPIQEFLAEAGKDWQIN